MHDLVLCRHQLGISFLSCSVRGQHNQIKIRAFFPNLHVAFQLLRYSDSEKDVCTQIIVCFSSCVSQSDKKYYLLLQTFLVFLDSPRKNIIFSDSFDSAKLSQ